MYKRQVIEYIVNRYGFAEVDKDAEEFPEEYQQMRASFIIQYAPELLGESTAVSYTHLFVRAREL